MTINECKAFSKEIARAGTPGRLGLTRYDVFEWLLRFSQTDLEVLNEKDLKNLFYEVACFVKFKCGEALQANDFVQPNLCLKNWGGRFYSQTDNLQNNHSTASIRHAISVYHDAFFLQPSLPRKEDLQTLQDQTRGALTSLIDRHSLILQQPGSTQYFLRYPQSHTFSSVVLADSPQDLFMIHFLEFLKECGQALSKCPGCLMIFYGRTNKTYCSLKCQSREATRRFRGTPPDRIGKRGRPKGSTKKKAIPQTPTTSSTPQTRRKTHVKKISRRR